MPRTAPAVCVLASLIAGCSSSNGTAPHQPTGPEKLVVLSGFNQTDTIGATLPETLVVQISGFNTLSGHGVGFQDNSNLTISPAGPDTTDSHGIARYVVTFGTNAGNIVTKAVIATDRAPFENLSSTWTYVVKPGQAAHVVLSAALGSVYIDSSTTVTIQHAYDRALNPTTSSAPVALTYLSGPGTLSGATVTGSGLGQVVFRAAAVDTVQTLSVSVVPVGTLAAPSDAGISVYDLDQLNVRSIVVGGAPVNDFIDVRWAPNGRQLLVNGLTDGGGSPVQGWFVIDTMGNVSAQIDTSIHGVANAVFSRDGQWIYFSKAVSSFGGCTCVALFRAPANGSGPEDSLPNAAPGVIDDVPSPSPDGTQLAYTSSSQQGMYHLKVLTIATGAVADLGPSAQAVSWSPGSNVIAYATSDGHLALIHSDGTGQRILGSALSHLDWSPDGQYVVGSAPNTVSIVRVADGLYLPLAGAQSPVSWRPPVSAAAASRVTRRPTHHPSHGG